MTPSWRVDCEICMIQVKAFEWRQLDEAIELQAGNTNRNLIFLVMSQFDPLAFAPVNRNDPHSA